MGNGAKSILCWEARLVLRGAPADRQSLAVTSFSLWANNSLCHSDLSHEDSSSGKPPHATGEECLSRRRRASGSGVLGSTLAAISFILWANRSLCQSDLSHDELSSGKWTTRTGEAGGEAQRRLRLLGFAAQPARQAGCRAAEGCSATPRGCSKLAARCLAGRCGGISPQLTNSGYNRLPGGH